MKHYFHVSIKGKSRPIEFKSATPDGASPEFTIQITKKEKEKLEKMRETIITQRLLPFDWDLIEKGDK